MVIFHSYVSLPEGKCGKSMKDSPFYSWVDQLFQWPHIQEQTVSLPEGSQG
jgi:hypothetical protein